jgi:hypothetical protein
MAQQLWRYDHDPRWNKHTLAEMISTYAPAQDRNDVLAYIADVAQRSGLDPKVLAPLLSAMVRHEQGRQPFSVSFKNAPPGTEAKATVNGSWAPTRVSYSMPTTLTP